MVQKRVKRPRAKLPDPALSAGPVMTGEVAIVFPLTISPSFDLTDLLIRAKKICDGGLAFRQNKIRDAVYILKLKALTPATPASAFPFHRLEA